MKVLILSGRYQGLVGVINGRFGARVRVDLGPGKRCVMYDTNQVLAV